MTRPSSYAQRRKQALRTEILDAAFDVFAERGYHDAGVAEIAERVGIGHSTFYRQFQSKREILDQVIDTVLERTTAALAAENAPEAANTPDEYRAQVRRIAAALDEITRDTRAVRLMFQSLGVDAEAEQRLFNVFAIGIAFTADYVEHGQRAGYLRADLDKDATARAVVGMIAGNVLLGLDTGTDPGMRTRTVDAVVSLLFDGVVER